MEEVEEVEKEVVEEPPPQLRMIRKMGQDVEFIIPDQENNTNTITTSNDLETYNINDNK